MYVTAIVSPLTTDLELEKSPAENNVPVVESLVALPPILIKQPATVPVLVIENDTAEEVVLLPAEAALKEGVGMMMPEEQQAAPPAGGGGGRPKSPYDQDRGPTFSLANSPFRFAEGGLTTLKGGGIMMREGQYVVPADVVSAIGNGSSKAGAKFLEQAFNHYIQNGPPEGVKPAPRAGNLAEQRMMERVQRQAG